MADAVTLTNNDTGAFQVPDVVEKLAVANDSFVLPCKAGARDVPLYTAAGCMDPAAPYVPCGDYPLVPFDGFDGAFAFFGPMIDKRQRSEMTAVQAFEAAHGQQLEVYIRNNGQLLAQHRAHSNLIAGAGARSSSRVASAAQLKPLPALAAMDLNANPAPLLYSDDELQAGEEQEEKEGEEDEDEGEEPGAGTGEHVAAGATAE